MAEQRYTAEQVAAAITRAAGIKAYAAKALGCERTTIENYCKRYAACRDAVAVARETLIDSAEGQLTRAVAAGDLAAVKFVLTTIGKDRGYVETVRNEHTGADGGPIQVEATDARERLRAQVTVLAERRLLPAAEDAEVQERRA